jgi:hypothetical protein
MIPKTKHQIFKEWLVDATIDELEEELFDLDETNLSLLSQLAQHELRFKAEIPTQENEEWKGRADHLQRWTYYQKRTIERRIAAKKRELAAELKAENSRRNMEAALLKEKLKSERVANLNTPDAELRKAERNRLAEEAIRMHHERVASHDQMWIQAAKIVLDKATFKRITTVADELSEAADRQQEDQ